MAITPLPRPSVSVEQILQTTTPQNATATLLPCLIGKCTQTVPAQVATASGGRQINAQAKTTMPAMLQAIDATGDPLVYALVENDCLVFNVTNRPKVVVPVTSSGDYTPADVVDLIRAAMVDVGETEAVASVVKDIGGSASGRSFRITTLGKTVDATLEIDPEGRSAAMVAGSADLSALSYPGDVAGLTLIVSIDNGVNQTYTAASPGNAAALISAISSAFTGATAALGSGNILELSSDLVGETSKVEIIGGTMLTVLGLTAGDVDTGTGSTSNALTVFGFDTTDLAFGAAEYRNYHLEIPPSAFPDPRGNLAQTVLETDTIRAFLSTSGGAALSEPSRSTALLRKATAAVTVIDDGNGDNRSPIINLAGQNLLNPTPTAAQVTGASAPNFASLSNKPVILSDGTAPRTVNFGTVTNISEVVAAINAVFDTGDGLIASNSGGFLRLTGTRLREDGSTTATGEDSQIVVVGGTGAPYLDSNVTPVLKTGRFTGNPHKVLVGDELYVDGVRKGKVIQVAPSGNTARVKLDTQLPLDFTGTTFHFVANNLKSINDGGATDRPAPNLIVESDGQVILKGGILRNTQGVVTESVISSTLYPGKASIYLQYRALRLDVTRISDDGLLTLPDTTTIESLLEPIDQTNPLGLAAYVAKLNAPLLNVYALGIEAFSADQPDGTTAAHTEAASYLEGFEVYGLAVMSQDLDVGAVWSAHVTKMSAPEKKRERIVFLNLKHPTRALDALIASGAEGNTVGNTGLTFDTGLADLAQLVLEAGLNPSASIDADEGLFLDIESDSKRYSISDISGSVVTLRTTFGPGDNTDGFYSESAISGTLIDVTFAVRLRGAKLELSDGSIDKAAIAQTLAETGQSFSNRRVYATMPEACTMLIDGVEVEVPGYYMNAATVGLISAMPPQQSFTNVPIAGIKRAVRSYPYFKDEHLDLIAGGGVWIFMQETASGPVFSRMAVSTDRSSLETQTDSITKQLDFVAKYERQVLRPMLGRLNVEDNSADLLNTTLQSARDFLVNGSKAVKSLDITNVEVEGKDQYVIDQTVGVFYPINGIKVRLFI